MATTATAIRRSIVNAKGKTARRVVAKTASKAIDKLERKVVELKLLIDTLLKLSTPASDLHYKTAKQVHAIMTHPDYEKRGPQFPRELDEILMKVLPGMGKLTLKNMYQFFPDKKSWDTMNIKQIYDATINKMTSQRPKSAKGVKTKGKPIKASLTGKGQIDTTGRLNEGGGVGGLKVSELQEMRDQIASLTQENAELRQSRDEAYRRIGELEMQLKKMGG